MPRSAQQWMPSARSRAIAGFLRVLLGALVAAGVATWLLDAHYRGRIYPGVDILGVPVGGLTAASARERLAGTLGAEPLPAILLTASNGEWLVSASALGLRADLEGAVRSAQHFGRSGIFHRDMLDRARAFWYGYHIVPEVTLEPGEALASLRRVALQAAPPEGTASLAVAGLLVRLGRAGTRRDLDVPATRARIVAAVSARLGASAGYSEPRVARLVRNVPLAIGDGLEPVPVPLAFRQAAPLVTEVPGAAERLADILADPILLVARLPETVDGSLRVDTRTWAIDPAIISTWLALQPRVADERSGERIVAVERTAVRAWVERLSEALDRPSREGRYDYDPSERTLRTLSPEQYGWALEVDEAAERISRACGAEGERRVELPVRSIAPRVTREDLEALLPLSLIAEGETSLAGATPERLQNVRSAAARFHGRVVPGSTSFSFLDTLGPVTVAEGYTRAWAMLDEPTVLGPAGGVGQVSTTCFRAAFFGGYPIEERWAHSYRVDWYEPPLGLDAAVYSPDRDLRFRNDTETPILILTEVDEIAARLVFRFYGAPRTREVTMDGPVTANETPAGDPVFAPDYTLAAGERREEEPAHDGVDVTVYRVIREGDRTMREEYVSRYAPQPARMRVGVAP